MVIFRRNLPITLAATAWLVYVITLAWGMTQNSLPLTASVAGWDWQPLVGRPITWLLTMPFQLLPGSVLPVALNLLAATLAAIVLGLLARAVELLPWDCIPDAKRIWQKNFPAVFAVSALGLSFNFWREATSMTGELPGLILLASAIWLMLEFRASLQVRWLEASALVWGLGMAENWVMLVALPLYIFGLLWLRGPFFPERTFLKRIGFALAAGFATILLPPLLNGLNPHSPWSFGHGWIMAVQPWKETFHALRFDFWMWHRSLAIAVPLFFLVPAAACLLRIRNEALLGQPDIDRYQIWFFRILRFGLLLVSLWLLCDPAVGAREIVHQKMGITLPLLTLDWFTALGVAYLAGSLLYAAQILPEYFPRNLVEHFNDRLRVATPWLFSGFALVVLMGFSMRNAPAIWQSNHFRLQSYGETLARSLPDCGGIVLSDDVTTLALLDAALAKGNPAGQWQLVCLPLLSDGKYRTYLERRYRAGWQSGKTSNLKLNDVLQLLGSLAQKQRIFFVQPHNGSFLFELFQPQPLGAVSELKLRRLDELSQLTVSADVLTAGEKFWDGEWQGRLAWLADNLPVQDKVKKLSKRHLALQQAPRDELRQLGRLYSANLNDWGVTLQKQGALSAAHNRFQQALVLNPENFSAAVNLYSCTNLMVGKPAPMTSVARLAENIRTLSRLAQIILACGETDDAMLHCIIGNACLAANWPRQAWQEFDRARSLAPDEPAPQLALAKINLKIGRYAEVLAVATQLRSKVNATPAGQALDIEVSLLEATTYAAQTNRVAAAEVLSALLTKYPGDDTVAREVARIYILTGNPEGALTLIQSQLQKNPDSLAALNNQGALLIQMQRAAEALPVLNHALTISNLPSIQLNRAIAYLQLKDYSAAQQDYLQLIGAKVDQFRVHFGLAEIAWQRHETNVAVQHFKASLTNTASGTYQWEKVNERLEELNINNSDPRTLQTH
jgi:tetratricopeptide (TPR) repeat protein